MRKSLHVTYPISVLQCKMATVLMMTHYLRDFKSSLPSKPELDENNIIKQ